MYGEQKPKINVREFVQEIGQFSSFGNEIYREGNPRELLSRLSKLGNKTTYLTRNRRLVR